MPQFYAKIKITLLKSTEKYAKIQKATYKKEIFIMDWLNSWIKTSSKTDNATSPIHIHDRCELLFLIEGRAQMRIGSTEYTLTPGTLAIIGALEPHELIPTSFPYTRIGMHVNTALLDSIGISTRLSSILSEHTEDFCHVIGLDEGDDIERLAREIFEEYMGKDDMSEKLSEMLFHQLLIKLCRSHPEGFTTPDNDSEMEEAKRYLDKSFAEDISVNELAQRFFLTPSHFIVRFKRYTGYTPCKYKGMRRLERARTLLSDRRLTLGEVAEMCGYSDLNSFVRSFRQAMNVTPGQFRSLSSSKNIEM